MTQRLIKHFMSLCGSQVINLLGSVLLVPIFLAHWPVVIYGEWLALSSLANYLGTLDFGMNSAAGNSMLEAHVKNDDVQYIRYLHSATVFYTLVGGVGTIVCGIVALFAPIGHWLGARALAPHTAALTWFLLSLQPLWSMLVGLIQNIYRTHGDPARTVWFNNARTVATLLTTGLAVALGANLPIVACVSVVLTALTLIVIVFDVKRMYPTVKLGVAGATLADITQLLKPSLAFAGITIGIALTMQGSVMVVSSVLGGAAVAVFVTCRTLCNAAMQVGNLLKFSVWPDLTILYAQQDFPRLRVMNHLLTPVTVALSIGVAATLMFDGPSIIALWTHHKIAVPLLFLRLMLIYLVIQGAWQACAVFPIATNNHRGVAISYIVSSVSGVLISLVLVRKIGLPGIPIALMMGEALACYHFVIRDTCRLIKEPYRLFAARIWLGGALLGIVVCSLAGLVNFTARGPMPLQWIEVGITAFASSFGLLWFFWLNPTTRTALLSRSHTLRSKLGFTG